MYKINYTLLCKLLRYFERTESLKESHKCGTGVCVKRCLTKKHQQFKAIRRHRVIDIVSHRVVKATLPL